MNTFSVVFILVFVIIMVVVGKKSYENGKRLAQEGKVSAKKGAFWKEKEVFTTSVSYEALCQKLKEADFSDTKASVQFDLNGEKMIFFQSSDAWNAVLEQCGARDGKNLFQFYFSAWRTGQSGTVKVLSMNVLVTMIEKTILSLDPTATVCTHKQQIRRS